MRNRFPLVAALFLVSGATGLLYEVAFSKLLAYVFGATAYAVSTVLASFMGGLALGAHFGGRYASRARKPLVLYGVLEITVGVVCALSPFAFELVTRSYVALARSAPDSLALVTAARAGMTALLVIVPTVAMGATLPVLSRVIAGAPLGGGGLGGRGERGERGERDERDERGASGRRLASLYAINTAGGAAGAMASAYAILPLLGIRGTMMSAALANIVIGAVALLVGRASPPIETDISALVTTMKSPTGEAPVAAVAAGSSAVAAITAAPSPAEDAAERLFLVLAFVSGYLVFAAEVVETHLLALLIGNSAYAFGLMLAVFLVCLSIGAARAPAFSKRNGPAALSRGLAVAGVALAITLPLWDQLPHVFTFAGKHVSSWAGRELCRALAALVILVLPTLWMGSTFPLLLERVAARADVASRVGRLTVANTVGTIFGSILTGYVILPALGSQNALKAVAIAFALASLAAARAVDATRTTDRPPETRRALVAGAIAGALVVALPSWNMARLTSGANVYFTVGPPPEAIEFVREDVHGGVTTVARRGAVRTLYTNGKFQGDDGAEMMAQRRFAHFPSLFVPAYDRVLVIGLGTGTTLGTLSTYPWKRIDVAEISPSIVEASRHYYADQTLHALDDPRVHLELNDGRNVLLVAAAPYDLVTMELTSVWFAGASSLYSREFYELARARLTKGGVLQQWVQLHHIRREELATIVKTLHEVFPHVALFVGGGQGILVASGSPLRASREALGRLEQSPRLLETLGGGRLSDTLKELVASEGELTRFVADTPGATTSTDDNLYLEYATPKGNVMNYDASLRATLATLEGYRTAGAEERHLGP